MLVTNLIQLIRDIGSASEIIDDPEIFDNAASTGRNIARTINGKNYGSIKQVSKDLIATYPMLFSDSISLDSAVLISNAFEHEYTYMISLIINDRIVTSATSASEVVSGFHQNITRYESYESDKVFIDQKFNGSNLNNKTFPKIFIEDSKNRIYPNNSNNRNNDFIEYNLDQKLAISDKDIRNYNDLTPTILQVNLTCMNKDSVPVSKQTAIGVKALIHKLPSAEIALNLSQAVKGSNNLFKLIRWTTGELKLVRDLLLCVDENKKYAKDSIKSDSFWWKKLNDIYKMNKFYKWLKVLSPKKNFKGAIPTATLVISISDINNIKSMYGIDLLRQTDLTRKMFDKLSLLTFAIVDESIETLYVYDENNRFFAQYPFRSLKVKKANDGSVDIEDLKPLFKR